METRTKNTIGAMIALVLFSTTIGAATMYLVRKFQLWGFLMGTIIAAIVGLVFAVRYYKGKAVGAAVLYALPGIIIGGIIGWTGWPK